jgi:hypothetical protein
MEMVATQMAMGTMVETRETTPMATRIVTMVTTMEAMEITLEAMGTKMEAMDNNVLRRIYRISSAIIARSQDILRICAQRRNKMMQPNPIHSRGVM